MSVIQLEDIYLYISEATKYNFNIFNGGRAQGGKGACGPLKSCVRKLS